MEAIVTYTTLRGKIVDYKPYGQYTLMERQEILEYYVANGRAATRQKFNLNNEVMSHLIYHGKATIETIEDDNLEKAGL
jgi:hypothetical protein